MKQQNFTTVLFESSAKICRHVRILELVLHIWRTLCVTMYTCVLPLISILSYITTTTTTTITEASYDTLFQNKFSRKFDLLLTLWNSSSLSLHRVQPTRCNVLQFISFCKTLYMFQTSFPSIIRSSKLHIQRQVFVRPLLLLAASHQASSK
jgi:hypothetical protein